MESLRRFAEALERRSPAQRRTILGVTLAALVVVGSWRWVAIEDDPALRYAICEHNVATARLVPGPGPDSPFAVAVQLTEPATEEFIRLTAAHVGGDVEVVFSSWVFAAYSLDSANGSGVIATDYSFSSRDEAVQALRELKFALPRRPCGLIP